MEGSDDTSPMRTDDRHMKDKHVLVTGASGFIGRSLCKRLRESGCKVTGLSQRDGDISQRDYFERYVNLAVDHVFHLASRTFVPDSWEDPGAFYATNVIGTVNVLEYCRIKKAPLTFVSAYIYGPQESQPISEDAKILPSNPYAHSKHLAEQVCEFYAKTFSIQCTVVRPFNVYGFGQSEIFLIPTIFNQIMSGTEVQVRDLSPKRDYIYIADLVDFLVLTTRQRKNFSIYNAGSGSSLSVLDIIRTIGKQCNKDIKIIEEGIARRKELSNTIADIDKAKLEMGWAPRYTFESGIADILRQMAVPQ